MYKKGTIVLIPFPFTDLSGSKVRPAVIVSKGKIGDDVIVVFITAQPKLKGTHVIRITPDAGNGLKVHSSIMCTKIATLDTKIVLGELGHVSQEVGRNIDEELVRVLGL